MTNLRIFGLGSSKEFAENITSIWANTSVHSREERLTNVCSGKLSKHHEERHPDGEAYTVSQANVRGCDVYVVTSLYGDNIECVDQKLMKAAIFINSLRHASAERITLVAPYLCYARQDRKDRSRAPIATQAIAMMLEAVGMDRLLTMDVHNLGAEQNAFRVPIDNLEARKLFADVISKDIIFQEEQCNKQLSWKVLTPDAGGANRTKLMQYSLSKRIGREVGIVYADKNRIDANTVVVKIIGDVEECRVIVIDDLISTGGTLAECQKAVREAGGILWGVAATHGLYVNSASQKLSSIPRIYTTDTVPPFRLSGSGTLGSVKVISTAEMFGEAIRRIHTEGGSISELLSD